MLSASVLVARIPRKNLVSFAQKNSKIVLNAMAAYVMNVLLDLTPRRIN